MMSLSFRYIHRNSFIHHLNPLTKLLVLILISIDIFILNFSLFNLQLTIGVFLCLLIIFKASKIQLKVILRKIRFLFVFSGLILLTQVIFVPEGTQLGFLIPTWIPYIGGSLPISYESIIRGTMIAFTFLIIVVGSLLFVSTTHPEEFANSLTRIGIPYRIAYTLTLALRLVPLFDAEANQVMDAQRARGIDTHTKSPRGVIRLMRFTFVPMVVSALSRVDSLTISMEARGFGYRKNRTYLHRSRFQIRDVIIVLTAIFLSLGVFLLN